MRVEWNGCPAEWYFKPVRPGCACEYIRTVIQIEQAIHDWNLREGRGEVRHELDWSDDGEECTVNVETRYNHWTVSLS